MNDVLTKFNDLSGLGISEIMTNIMSFHHFFIIDNINSDSYMSYWYCAIIFVKRIFIVEKEEGKFENILKQVLKHTNDSTLHDKYNILTCKVAIPSIVK